MNLIQFKLISRRTPLHAWLIAVLGLALFPAPGRSEAPPTRTPDTDAQYYVAVDGNDSNPGTRAAPFATLAKARDAVRENVRVGLRKNVLVLIGGGTYQESETLRFGPEDSGTETHSITYASMPGEQVLLTGGRKIGAWKKSASEIWTTEIPEAKEGKWYFRQLFVDGTRATRARTPNADDKVAWWKIKTSSVGKDTNDREDIPIKVTVTGPIRAYGNPSDVELVYMQNNESGQKRLGTIDEKDQTFTLAPPHRWNPKAFLCDWYLSKPFAGKSCYLENALEMLDEPGEWYLDRKTGVLSYWPRPGEDMTKAEVIAPVTEKTLVAVEGTRDHPIVNVHFKGIHVAYIDWPLPAWGYSPLFCCNVATLDGPKPGHRFIDAAVEFAHARYCSFRDGGIAHAGGMGLCLREGTAYIAVEGNEIADLGGGGIGAGGCNTAAGYLDAAPAPAPGEFEGYRISNNDIHHCGMTLYGAVGVILMLARDSSISHNLIHDTAYLGIGVAGSQDPKVPFARNNTIEYNHIYNAMKVTVDGAGMYITFASPGTLIRGNLIHDTQGNPYHLNWGAHPPSAGIYLDGFNSGCRYEGNVLYRNLAAGPLIFDYDGAFSKNSWSDNLFQKEGTPPQEFIEAMGAFSGLEPRYQKSILGLEPIACQYSVLGGASPTDATAVYQFDLPAENKGVVEIIRRETGGNGPATFAMQGLSAASHYELTCYSGILKAQSVWGSGTMPFLSEVQAMPMSELGVPSVDGKTVLTGQELCGKGLSVKLGASPRVVWMVYRKD